MEFVKLELDLTGLKKADTCYLLEGASTGLAGALSQAGITVVALDAVTDSPSESLRVCKGEGRSALTNLETAPDRWEFTGEAAFTLSLSKLHIPLAKADGAEEERFVYGEVLIPDHTDAHGHTISAALVRKNSHDYMANFRQIGLQHGRMVTGKVAILESYIAPVDFEFAGARIRQGTWMMGVRVQDDGLWSMIKAGELTGFSIGGWGRVDALNE